MGVYYRAQLVVAIECPDFDEWGYEIDDYPDYEEAFGGQWLVRPLTGYPSGKGGGAVQLTLDELSSLYDKAKEEIEAMKEKFPDSEPTIQLMCDHDAW